jgi:hypothetical protein
MESPWPGNVGIQRGEITCVMAKRRVGKSMLRWQRIRRGDFVEWSPTGARGLWKVVEVAPARDAADMTPEEVREALVEDRADELVVDIDREILRDLGMPVTEVEPPSRRIVIRHFAGWCGDEVELEVPTKDVRTLTELEVLGLAGT